MLTVCLTASLLAGLPLPHAIGQNELGDGTALDRNPQIGSGGINPLRRGQDYSLGNDIITGNVTGAGFFRDDVGYGAPGEFMDELGSDDLFRFRARSAPTLDPYQPTSTRRQFEPRAVYRSFASPDAGRFLPTPGRRIVRPNASGLYRGYDVTRGVGVPAVGLTSPVAQTVSLMPQGNGRMLEISASPLLGIRQHLHGLSARPGPPQTRRDKDESDDDGDSDANENPLVERFDSRIKLTEPIAAAAKMLDPSIEMGWQLDNRLYPQRLLDPNFTVKAKLERIEQKLFGPLAQALGETDDDVYMDQLKQVNERYRGLLLPGEESDPTDSGETTQPSDVEPSPWPILFEPPSDDLLRDAAAKRADAFEKALGIKPEPNLSDLETLLDPVAGSPSDEADGQDKDQIVVPEPDTTIGARFDPMQLLNAEDRRELERLLSALAHDRPGLKTLAGERATRINSKLRKGESLLAAGRYFDAEYTYRQVLIAKPRHPMARVGIIHSQLGAGMIRSAAFNLRTLFEQHPEMIVTRYQPNLLPAESRLKWARTEIEKTIKGSRQAQPAIVLAYLGHQVGQRQLVVYGLDLAQARSPLDPLIVLLRRIWLDEQSAISARRDANDEPAAHDSAGQSPETNK